MPKLPLSSLLLFFFLRLTSLSSTPLRAFREAPAFRNHATCPSPGLPTSTIHIVMTLDAAYLRGSVAAVHSVLRHATCPENLFFHFISSPPSTPFLLPTISSTFPSLPFLVHPFHPSLVLPFISPSLRPALDQPLNYARIYLPRLLPSNVSRVIYLDSDLVLVDDVSRLWSIDLAGAPLAAPEYCHANFTSYFTHRFWSHPSLPNLAFGRKSGRSQTRSRGRPPCYFNTGVMVMDLEKWREGDYTRKLEGWMRVQKEEVRIYELGSLPPFLLVFAGKVKRVGHRWNQHGLGGDNARGLCRDLHPGKVSLLHWSGKGKPWLRLDAGRPCPVDALWAPYDLMKKMRRWRSGGGAAAAAEVEVDDDLFVEG